MLNALQFIVFLMGVAAVCMSVRYAVFFWQSNKTLGMAMVGFLAEQIVSSVATLIFASNALFAVVTGIPEDSWNTIGPVTATLLRASMFGAMLHSTFRLNLEVRKVMREIDGIKPS